MGPVGNAVDSLMGGNPILPFDDEVAPIEDDQTIDTTVVVEVEQFLLVRVTIIQTRVLINES